MSAGSASATAYGLLSVLGISATTVVESAFGRLTAEKCDRRLRRWAKALVARAGVDLTIVGGERLPSPPLVLMSNHQSHFDIPVLYAAYPGPLRMVAKAELFRIPIWGR